MLYKPLMRMIDKRKTTELALDLESREVVIKNLVFLYHACIASEQLLALGAHESLRDGQFYQRLRKYYQTHLEEEKGEILLLRDDLASAQIEIGTPDRFVMGMIGTQYYMLYHVNPVCLLGYLAVQEADPTPLSVVDALEERYGKTLFRFIRMHAVKDLEHAQEIKELIESAPEALGDMIETSAENVLDHYSVAAQSWQMMRK